MGRARDLFLVLLLCSLAQPARAQDSRPGRPDQGLFAGDNSEPHRQLNLRWSSLGAFDNNVTVDTQTAFDPRFQVKGPYGTAGANLMFNAHGEHTSFAATAASGTRYYPGLKSFSAFDGSGGVTFAADLGARAKLQATQGFSYQPYYQLGFLNDPATAESLPVHSNDAALTTRTSFGYSGNVSLIEQFSPRSAFAVDYAYRYTRFSTGAERFLWQLAHTRFTHHLTRNASLRLGYGYGKGQYGVQSGGTPVESHDLDVGIDYSRALAFSRRTRLNFGSGSTIVRAPTGALDYRLNADATLNREIGRSWNVNLSYHRGVQFIEGFAEPSYADTVRLQAGGLLTRRLSVGASGGYSAGELGASAERQRYGTYTATSDLRLAISRTLSAYAQYTYYHYDFAGAVVLPFEVPRALNRQGLRLGIAGWLPLFRSKR